MKSYRELEVWRKSMDLVEEVYRLCRDRPDDERFGLISQMRRAAVSIPANVAEGYGRAHVGDYLRHLAIARGSLMEPETLLTIAGRLEFLTRDRVRSAWAIGQEVGKMLTCMILKLQEKRPRN